MRVLVIENFVGTPSGLVGEALRETGVEIDLRRAHVGEPVPSTDVDHDGLVVLGGAQSALDDAEHPYLPVVADLTRKFGEADKAVLGICLGAQLVARGYGARNILRRPVEFGWREVRPTPAGRADPLIRALGDAAPLFHWHEDTFTLPDGAVHLATSDMTEFQAFRIGRTVYGIQFHFEADRKLVTRWSREFADVIAGHDPDWPRRHTIESERSGSLADAKGQAIARAWVKLLRPSPRRASAATSRTDPNIIGVER